MLPGFSVVKVSVMKVQTRALKLESFRLPVFSQQAEVIRFYEGQHCLGLGKRVRSVDLKELRWLRYVHFLDTTIKNLAAKKISKLSFRLPILAQHHRNIDTWIIIDVKKCVKVLTLDFSDRDL
ncbi:hypothetical protein ACOSQ3_002671 [Xanthoceras sorbifolium]